MGKKAEIEIRILLKNRQATERNVEKLGAKPTSVYRLIDYWFCPKESKNWQAALIDNTGFALRIRETKDQYGGRSLATLECKTLCDGKDHSLCHEHEVPLSDPISIRHILTDIGLKIFLKVDKIRTIYQYRKIQFCFDDIKGVGQGLEIEMMAKENPAEVKKELLALAERIGIEKDEILDKGLTYLAMKKMGKF